MVDDWSEERALRQDTLDSRNGNTQDERTVMRLRLGVGLIGIMLPVALPLGNWLWAEFRGLSTTGFWPASMSGSYYTSTRNIFVGSLCALGVFLICYRFDRRDDRWSTAAGLFALGVALFPTSPGRDADAVQATVGVLHLVFAGLLLFVLAMFCIYSFRDPHYAQKPWVSRSYLVAGVLILVFETLAVIAGVTGFGRDWQVRPVYLGEWFSVWAFGAAWIGAALELGSGIGAMGRSRALFQRLGPRTAPPPIESAAGPAPGPQ